ncbi:MAG: type II toxin-antitoxin system MqsR family toxin, partial [Rhodobacteraceae bacterium]|nr:type II toxin-antitoxin system MqsR family toxin [Paracoccaceae bacterium]
RKPSYNLASIRDNVSDLIFTKTALHGASEMGMTRSDMENVIENLTNRNFYKSMTTNYNHKIWMDVYHGQTDEFEIYIKFVKSSEEFVCTSFKEKQPW